MKMSENGEKHKIQETTTTTNAVLYTIKYQYSQMIMTKLIKCTNI